MKSFKEIVTYQVYLEWKSGKDLTEDANLFDDLFNYYMDLGEIPYGTAKARDGDPYQWIFDQLEIDIPMYWEK